MAMNVKQLKELLSEFPDDMQVIMSKDAEGNDYSPLEEGNAGYYSANSTWSGGFNAHLDEDKKVEMPLAVCNALCLWPVN